MYCMLCKHLRIIIQVCVYESEAYSSICAGVVYGGWGCVCNWKVTSSNPVLRKAAMSLLGPCTRSLTSLKMFQGRWTAKSKLRPHLCMLCLQKESKILHAETNSFRCTYSHTIIQMANKAFH